MARGRTGPPLRPQMLRFARFALPARPAERYGGDQMGPAADQTTTVRRRLKVREAAEELGITVEAVRGRIKRGTLGHHKAPDGTVYVWLADASGDRTRPDEAHHSDRTSDRSDDQSPLLARLEDEVLFLRRELERKDAILLRLAPSESPSCPPHRRIGSRKNLRGTTTAW